jgi:hypothetical protein
MERCALALWGFSHRPTDMSPLHVHP